MCHFGSKRQQGLSHFSAASGSPAATDLYSGRLSSAPSELSQLPLVAACRLLRARIPCPARHFLRSKEGRFVWDYRQEWFWEIDVASNHRWYADTHPRRCCS